MSKLIEAVTKKAQIRQMMNAIKEMLGDKTLPKSTMDHMEALNADLKKTWETLSASGESDQVESLHESMTIGSSLESDLHSTFVCRVDAMYAQGALTRDERDQLLTTVNDVTDAFYTAIMDAAPQLYDHSPWMDAPEPDEQNMMAEAAKGKTENGEVFPKSDYAYTPSDAPSSWKLRLTKTPGGDPDPGIVGAAIAALGKGFRGQKVQIPTGDLPGVKAKVRAAWKKANPDKKDTEMPDTLKEAIQEAQNLTLLESDFTELIEKSVRPDGTATIRVISPGWGASGYYPPEVLQRDGPKVFKAGLQSFWNHQTAEEEAARPEGDLNTLAAKLITDARWMPDHPKGPGLYADAQIYQPYQQAVNEMGPDIGISIRALGKAQAGTAEGKQGPIIQEIATAKSIDWVTRPGAGGAVLQLFESARRGAAQITIIQKGDETMDEKALQEAKEANAQLRTELEKIREQMILREAGERAAVKLAGADLPVVTKNRLIRDLVKATPIKDGKLDLTAFDAQVTEAVKLETAYLVEVTGGGKITGMGSPHDTEPKPEEALASMKESYMAMGYSPESAALMAKGR